MKMIRKTIVAEKCDQALPFCVLNRSLRRFTLALGTGDPSLSLSTGAETPAYYQSASWIGPAKHTASSLSTKQVK
jgi:hypothetical protein